jgi:cold shock CspA family protein
MADKVKGTVKWFSNRKGFGFITPISDIDSESDIAPTEDDIFVHQSGIVMETKESYRTLKDGLEVAYDVITKRTP